MLSVAPALANSAGAAAAAVSAAFAVTLSVLAFSPLAHATNAVRPSANGIRVRGSRTMLCMGAPRVVDHEKEMLRAGVSGGCLEIVNVTGLSIHPGDLFVIPSGRSG